MKFEMLNTEIEKYNKWYAKLSKKDKMKGVDFIFSLSSGIGQNVKARCGDKEIDLTDYDMW
jgi:hypothetical protein